MSVFKSEQDRLLGDSPYTAGYGKRVIRNAVHGLGPMHGPTLARHASVTLGPLPAVQQLVCRPARAAQVGPPRAYTPRQDPATRLPNYSQPYVPGSWQPQRSPGAGASELGILSRGMGLRHG